MCLTQIFIGCTSESVASHSKLTFNPIKHVSVRRRPFYRAQIAEITWCSVTEL